jgi:hypothetical protein
VTRYEFFRKRIAPVLFLGMVGLIAYDTCKKEERHHATIVIDLGAAEPRVKSVTVDLFVDNESISRFERRALSTLTIGCPCKFETAMPAEHGELRFDVEVDGVHRQLTKKIHVIEGGKTTVQLGPDLSTPL